MQRIYIQLLYKSSEIYREYGLKNFKFVSYYHNMHYIFVCIDFCSYRILKCVSKCNLKTDKKYT